ncbi:hypothetical protein ACFVJK_00250, partial [Streptomyces sp. NPDC127172]|uniref:hypothetical protein n=1 Tax=Streptomyces sp. NPDC127172 TaxID=3345382 RepID=UPI003626E15F
RVDAAGHLIDEMYAGSREKWRPASPLEGCVAVRHYGVRPRRISRNSSSICVTWRRSSAASGRASRSPPVPPERP